MEESSKRKRVRQACDYCRSRKAKCDGASPTCSACAANGETCIYTSSNKRRGLPTGYTHDLEKKIILFQSLIGFLINSDNTPDNVLENSLIRFISDPKQKNNLITNCQNYQKIWSNSSLSNLFNQFILEEGDQLHEFKNNGLGNNRSISKLATKNQLAGPVTPSSKINQLSSSKEDDWHPVTLQYHGLSSLVSGFTNRSIQLYNKKLPPNAAKPFNVCSIFSIRSSKVQSPPKEVFQFPSNSRKLIDLYFHIIHPLFPMLNRISIIRYTNKSFDNIDTDNSDLNFISLIWSVLAISKTFFNGLRLEHNKQLAIIYAKNSTLALENSSSSTIETIQSMILLGYYHYISGEWDNSWVLISSATRMAIDVKLMKKFEDDDSSTYTIRERTWATVYIMNTLLSSRMGRPPLIRALDWPIPVISEDEWEEWEAWKEVEDMSVPSNFNSSKNKLLELESGRCLSIHNNLLSIVAILNLAITATIDTNPSLNSSSERVNLSVFESKLSHWYSNLPSYCNLKDDTVKVFGSNPVINKNPPFVIFLHLIYNLTWCILAIRLSGLNSSKDENLIVIRDKNYTSSIINIYSILNANCDNTNLPFLDYFISMGNFFPKMIVDESLNLSSLSRSILGVDKPRTSENFRKSLLTKYNELLRECSEGSITCKITLDLFNIMRSQDNTNETAKKSLKFDLLLNPINDYEAPKNNLINDGNNNTNKSLKPPINSLAPLTNSISQQIALPKIPSMSDITSNMAPTPNTANALNILNNVGPTPNAVNSQHDELDLFMLDTDFSKNDSRLDQFMKNLGFIGSLNFNDFAMNSNSLANNSSGLVSSSSTSSAVASAANTLMSVNSAGTSITSHTSNQINQNMSNGAVLAGNNENTNRNNNANPNIIAGNNENEFLSNSSVLTDLENYGLHEYLQSLVKEKNNS